MSSFALAATTWARRLLLPGLAVALAILAGCGGGGGGSGTVTPPPVVNTQAVTVDTGPANTINVLFTSVTICVPGSTTRCQTIDHIQVDTGSSGLRVMAQVLNATTASLPPQADSAGNPLVECMQFVDGFSWGPLKLADVRLAGELASSVPIQVIGDPSFSLIPSDCSSTGPPENTVATFGANGIIGLSYFLQDCGGGCVASTAPGLYYSCAASNTCQPAMVPLANQVTNPVAMFASDNNGVIIDLPAITTAGAVTVSGSLIFGIGTQSDNALGNVSVFTVDPQTGTVTTVYNGRTFPNSFFDSGSSIFAFGTNDFPICTGRGAGLYCPPTLQTLSAAVGGTNNRATTVTFNVGNGTSLFAANPTFTAFNDVAAPSSDSTSFDWGLPFYYGRRTYTAFELRSTSAGAGPYIAF